VNHHRRSAQVWHYTFSRDFTILPAHPHVHPQSEWATSAFAFPAIIADTHGMVYGIEKKENYRLQKKQKGSTLEPIHIERESGGKKGWATKLQYR